jgi:hypothetical protein
MEIISIKKEDMSEYGKSTTASVYSAHVKIKDIEHRATEMIEIISNTSWIDELNAVAKSTFKARAQRTIIKLVEQIASRIENEITAEFGEFMISESAQSTLDTQFEHTKIPLAELLKEKITGNPGFDFHTESKTQIICFGEAKFSGSINPHSKALNQIGEFIELEKDSAELIILANFASEEAVAKSLEGKRAYVAAFSINSNNPETIIKNALKSEAIDPLLKFPEVYIIGIETDA